MNKIKTIILLLCIATRISALQAEQTFAMIKPYAIKRNLTNAILDTIKQAGFTIIAMKKMMLTTDNMYQLYQHRTHKRWFTAYVKAMTISPALTMILEKDNAVQDWDQLKMMIRKHYCTTCKKNNIVHGSDSIEDAQREIALFFDKDECTDCKP